jgi:hypothetical protein
VGQRGHVKAGDCFFYGRKRKLSFANWIFVHYRRVSEIKTVEFLMIGYTVLRVRCCNVVVLNNVYAPSEEKSDDPKDSFMRN